MRQRKASFYPDPELSRDTHLASQDFHREEGKCFFFQIRIHEVILDQFDEHTTPIRGNLQVFFIICLGINKQKDYNA